jgi:uncharacterized protein (DUF2342 family)
MGFFRSVRAVSGASGAGPIDWNAVAEAATAAVEPGDLDVSASERRAYAAAVRDAHRELGTVAAIDFDLPDRVQVQDRHHWIDANVGTFERLMRPLEANTDAVPGVARAINTGSMAVALGFLAKHVLGQYDPLLLADGNSHKLYFVRPNIHRVAGQLDVPLPRFRRWIAFHEVTHAAEFGAAPWLPGHLESALERAVTGLAAGTLDRDSLGRLDTTMTAVEGYAELLMDRAFDARSDDLRRKLEARRRGRGPIERLIRRGLGLSVKRRQYERGKAFFDAVADRHGLAAAGTVWEAPAKLPTDAELDEPDRWMARVL